MLLSHCCCFFVKSCRFLVNPWTVACQAPLSMGFPRQEYWSGLPFSTPGHLPDPGIKPCASCNGRQILYHWDTREALLASSMNWEVSAHLLVYAFCWKRLLELILNSVNFFSQLFPLFRLGNFIVYLSIYSAIDPIHWGFYLVKHIFLNSKISTGSSF